MAIFVQLVITYNCELQLITVAAPTTAPASSPEAPEGNGRAQPADLRGNHERTTNELGRNATITYP